MNWTLEVQRRHCTPVVKREGSAVTQMYFKSRLFHRTLGKLILNFLTWKIVFIVATNSF